MHAHMTDVFGTPSNGIGMVRGLAVAWVGLVWLATGSALSTRIQLVFEYSTLPTASPSLEVLAVSSGMFLVLAGGVAIWAWIAVVSHRSVRGPDRMQWWLGVVAAGIACMPLLLVVARAMALPVPAPHVGELLWYSIWTGLSLTWITGGPVGRWSHEATAEAGRSPSRSASPRRKPDIRLGLGASNSDPNAAPGGSRSRDRNFVAIVCLFVAVVAFSGWWYWQSMRFWLQFQLGFNDFAHFAQRIINTARGNGVLMETPVLPMFWDHFNPGLLLVVPLWWFYPSAKLFFWIQAFCLASSAGILYAIARARGLRDWTAFWIAMGWLLMPSVGQMNVAYTYGWHPISCALPCMLMSYLNLSRHRIWGAMGWAALAASFEEGVVVAIGCFAGMMWLRAAFGDRMDRIHVEDAREFDSASRMAALHARWRWMARGWPWLVVLLVSLAAFLAVYRWSGLAEFQTGRFARLGTGPMAILCSPWLRPGVFFELLLRPRNAVFVGLLLGPMVLFASRAMAWSLVSVALPLGVLMLWEHMPAQSLAFQYPSVLLPMLMVGAIESCRESSVAFADRVRSESQAYSRAVGFAAACGVLGIFVGQMPWSCDSLLDVQSKTYGVVGDERRRLGEEDQRWLQTTMERFYEGRSLEDGMVAVPFSEQRVLATGRIAAHCLGAKDIETVGQFWQRYESLWDLDRTLASPVLRYDWVLVDYRETFQQTGEETQRLRDEALQQGFRSVLSKHGVEFFVAAKLRVPSAVP